MANVELLDSKLTAVADEIRELSGSPEKLDLDAMAENVREGNDEIALQKDLIERAVEALEGKVDPDLYNRGYADGVDDATPAPKNDVNYYDYDGTILYSYTAEEAMALTEEPALPEQEGLICQGWNISLEDMQSYVSKYGKRDVGAIYITDDGATRFYITLGEHDNPSVTINLYQYDARTTTIDWGDGSAPETFPTQYNGITTTHTYSALGDYIISAFPAEGSTLGVGGSAIRQAQEKNNGAILKRVALGRGVTRIDTGAFQYCRSLESITIPNGVEMRGGSVFTQCLSLKHITTPAGMTFKDGWEFRECVALRSVAFPDNALSAAYYMFQDCRSLESVTIPEGSKIRSCAFSRCSSLKSVVIPEGTTTDAAFQLFYECWSLESVAVPVSITTIPTSMFYRVYNARYYDFSKHTAVPTLESTTAFSSIPEDCKIFVPAALADEWKAATNWSTYADRIVGV